MIHTLAPLVALPVFCILLFVGMAVIGVCRVFGVDVEREWVLFVLGNALVSSVFLVVFLNLTGGWWISKARLDKAFDKREDK